MISGAGCWVPGAECCARCWVLGAECSGAVPRLLLCSGMGARRYQELDAWQLANELKLAVYALVDRSSASTDRRFCDQIKDSAASATSNLAEGFGCYRHPEFARYTRIAKASLTETHNHLADGADRRHWSPEQAGLLQTLADRAVGACVRLIAYLESTDAPKSKPRRRNRSSGT